MYSSRPVVSGRQGVIASGHHLATTAGLKMYARGGNAVDAGVAAGFALAVLKPQDNSLGGECPILVYSPAQGRVVAISGQGTAPRAATLGWFRERGIALIPGDGLLGATVPGMFGAYATALAQFGRLSLPEVLAPAIELAEEGFPVYAALRESLRLHQERYRQEWPSTAEVFLPGGTVPETGALLRQPALGQTLRRLAEAGAGGEGQSRAAAIEQAVELFYRGEIAQEMLHFSATAVVRDATGASHSGLLAEEDFAGYRTRLEEPVAVDYRDCRVHKCGPWTQGPVHLQQLKLLEGFDLGGMAHNGADHLHAYVECAKLAFADRDRYYGDPEFVEVPLARLLSAEHAAAWREQVNMERANNAARWERPPVEGTEGNYVGDTTHLDTADAEGLMMSATPSGAWIPSSPVIPGLGFPLGTRGQMFSLQEGHPNGLQPGKRPRTTLTPSIAFRQGRPWMAYGTPGGDMQDQWTVQFLLNVVDFGMDLQQALDAPSCHTLHFVNSFYPKTPGDGTVYVEEGIALAVLRELQERGHRIHLLPANVNGEVCAAVINPSTGRLEAAASRKSSGQAYAGAW